ncbi:hypothetical protein PIB30_022700 [Stylosanthes scabra]|uniref:Uncharacterized protein n=1 Tax=Stylosanthes scabra TaxID=79078 RepID=A0ABU6X823_9FABA|nr:hypothetical protein [Stylosanthes scabra]
MEVRERKRFRQKWVPTGRILEDEGAALLKNEEKGETGKVERPQEKQKKVINPIEFDEVQNILLKDWRGPVFDEIKPHWDIFWGLSRRVWIEVIGLSIYVWLEETFKNIAKLWGSYVYSDDRTGESLSFTVARFLIDCFEWEPINEWDTLKVEDREFECFVKEFGGEVYSRESHPNEIEKKLMNTTDSVTKSASWVQETPMPLAEGSPMTVVVRSLVEGGDGNLNFQDVTYIPVIEKQTIGINDDNVEGWREDYDACGRV